MADDPWAAFRVAPSAATVTPPADDPWARFRKPAADPAPAASLPPVTEPVVDVAPVAPGPAPEKPAPVAAVTDAPAAGAPGDGPAAIGRGIINGIPVVGPYALAGVNRGVAAVRTLQNGTTFPEELKKVEGFGEATAKENPVATTVGEIGGAALATAPLATAAPVAFGAGNAALPVRMGVSALTGASLGGADAAVRGEDPILGAVIGGVGGAAAPAIGAAAGKAASAIASKLKPAEAVPGIEELKAAARAAYERADEAGVQIAPPSFRAAVAGMRQNLRSAGLDRTIHPEATAALARLEETVGSAPTLQQYETLRKIAKDAAGSLKPEEQRMGSILVDKIDDFLDRLKPGDLVRGDAEVVAPALKEARAMWGRARRAELIEDAMTAAADRAGSTHSGGNIENTARQNLRSILASPKKRAGFSGDEIQAIRDVVRGGPVQNLARKVGKLAPEGLVGLMEIGAAVAHPGIMTTAVPAAGYVAKKYAEAANARGIQRLGDLVRSGGNLPVSSLALPAYEAGRATGGLIGTDAGLIFNTIRRAAADR